MEIIRRLKSNYLLKKANPNALRYTLALTVFIWLFSFSYFNNWPVSTSALVLSKNQLTSFREYYRLWSTMFVHGDIEHLGSNLILFLPFAYFLTGHFGPFLFPLLGIFLGGLINWIVVQTMPGDTFLIGISGVVYWMGAVYITLSFLIDRRDSWQKRLVRNTGVGLILFFPTSLVANVSYLSHALGFVLGIVSAFIYYFIFRKNILQAEDYEYVIEGDEEIVEEIFFNH